ncbi:MAG: Spy/CpxP family protein refolding chaperone [Acidobacteriaceae bacterium]
MFRIISLTGLLGIALLSGAAFGQEGGPPPPGADNMGPPPMEGRRPPMERAFHVGPHGRWWNNPDVAQKLSLTPDQQKKMEAVFEQSRPGLTQLLDAVHKEEAAMEPLLSADQQDDGKILAQIDRVAQARAELERANGRMLLGLRKVLNPQQWKTLQSFEPHGPFPRFGGGPRPGSDGPPQ